MSPDAATVHQGHSNGAVADSHHGHVVVAPDRSPKHRQNDMPLLSSAVPNTTGAPIPGRPSISSANQNSTEPSPAPSESLSPPAAAPTSRTPTPPARRRQQPKYFPHPDRLNRTTQDDETSLTLADREKNCDRRRPEEEDHDHPRLPAMATQTIGKTMTPFLREHIPGLYAPVAKSESNYPPSASSTTVVPPKDSNSKFCYRHRPDLKCRRAADESKMVSIQNSLERLPNADKQAITHVWSLFSAAPAKHRELMLQGIITQCCFPQLSTVSREVHEQLKIDFVTALPAEISYKILSYLDTVSLCKAAQVSRQWRQLADDDQVWHRMCEQHIDRKCTKCGWGLPLLERKRLKDWSRQQQIEKNKARQITNGTEYTPPPRIPTPLSLRSPTPPKREREVEEEPSQLKRQCLSRVGRGGRKEGDQQPQPQKLKSRPFKDVYRDRFRIGYNWRHGKCSIKILKGHSNGVTCLQLLDNILATGSYDATIKIWDIETGRELRTLKGHTRGIRTLQFDDSKLISGSLDNTVKIWNWHTGELLSSLQGHSDGVIGVHFEGEFLASGSIDTRVKVFNFVTKETFCLKGHTDWVNSVRVDTESRTVFSASDDFKVKLWDLNTRECIRTFDSHTAHVQQVLPLPPDFEPDESLLHPPATSSTSYQHGARRSADPNIGHDPPYSYNQRLGSTGGLDSTIRLIDTATGRCLKTFFGHFEGIWGLAGDTLRAVTAANDGMVKIWEPTSGRCERTFTGHRGPVTCVSLSDSRMASGGEDGEVRLYSFHDTEGMEELGTPS
ncbi:sulfur controller 2 [Magnaporthiopsis poae ATCC 64411]|uniref:Sulfur controller 2 n=1 Tax=Magnaporthiopsis poae (strain ATCC 64411 / 73-15) TaxID=644358 RepID=A0A0C4E9H7_MAGP6|nr:sulfur controller 2 [Magnaporthiopsis poae ATCC 64411]